MEPPPASQVSCQAIRFKMNSMTTKSTTTRRIGQYLSRLGVSSRELPGSNVSEEVLPYASMLATIFECFKEFFSLVLMIDGSLDHGSVLGSTSSEFSQYLGTYLL